MSEVDVVTPHADLDALLVELLGHWQRILGQDLGGAWVQGSFALGVPVERIVNTWALPDLLAWANP